MFPETFTIVIVEIVYQANCVLMETTWQELGGYQCTQIISCSTVYGYDILLFLAVFGID